MGVKIKRITIILSLILIALILVLSSVSCTGKKIVIGSKPFNEQYILAHMISLLLEQEGYQTDVQGGLGGTLINYEALKQGQINTYIEYTGTAYSVILDLPQKETWDSEEVYIESEEGLASSDDIYIAANLGFQNNYGIAVRKEWADEAGIKTISKLEEYAQDMSIGTDPEFATRSDGLPQIENVYGITFGDTRQMEPTLMYEAIKNRNVDAISGYTTDSRIDMFDLVFLEDDKNALIPYDAIILVEKDIIEDQEIMEVFKKLEGRITTDVMRQLNYRYDVEQEEARDIARQYLTEEGLLEN
ncbi:MAG: glycine betaine ABC transporter substrate-binding protein [Actinomycetota bacterium]